MRSLARFDPCFRSSAGRGTLLPARAQANQVLHVRSPHFPSRCVLEAGDQFQISLQPKSASARRLIPRIEIAFAKTDFALRSTQLEFPDGSTLRNEFVNPRPNADLQTDLFEAKLPADYQLVQPLKKK